MADNLPERSEQHGDHKATWMPPSLKNGFIVESTLPMNTEAERDLVLQVIESDALKGETLIGSNIYLGHYVIHPINLEDQNTGEVVEVARTILPQPEGLPVAFVSTGILESISRISWKHRQAPPFDPPLLVKLKSVPTGQGRRTYKLIPTKG